ncbi:HTH-type transcriptional regulator GltR [Clostridium tertium]|uniref:HTH-type transcriptional regulator GltR n=1 Tax=Clostridium tertium TaxID=1559 RepID=A0A6N2YCE7_9CLOT
MEIRHLQTFITIVELEGFTKAADYLGYAQSTITSHIQILENELGEVLFNRLGKKIVLTNIGRELVPYARQMLDLYKEIKNLTSDEKGVAGDLVIGVSESLTIYRLGKVVKEYNKSYPNVNIILKDANCSELRSRLCSGELDLLLTISPEIVDKELIVKKLKDETMVIVGAPDADLRFLMESSEGEFAREGIIFFEKGCLVRLTFENYLKEKKIRFRNPIELSSVEAIKNCVMNGLGISYLPYYAVKD